MTEIEHWIDVHTETSNYSKSDLVIKAICEEFEITRDKLFRFSSKQPLPTARYIYYYLAYKYDIYTTVTEIGESLGREHSTVSVGIDKIGGLIRINSSFRSKVKRIEKNLKL
jgi:chromosomal replication initiation ATPase DnaA